MIDTKGKEQGESTNMIKEVNYATYAIDHRDNLRIISFNDGFTKLTGFNEEDVYLGKMTLKDLIPAHCWEEYQIAVNRSVQSHDGCGYLEHPILKRDGSSIVVLCFGKKRKDGSEISDILITDVTRHIEAHNIILRQEKEKRLWLKKLSFISENEEEYIIDYNCRVDHFDITIIKDGEAKVIYSIDNYTDTLSSIPTIHPDDLEEYTNVFLSAPAHSGKATFDFRSTLFGKDYSWYRATYAPYLDKETDETHIIGRIINIDEEVMRNQELQRQAQIDALTSLYNQGTSRSKIDDLALCNPDKCINAFIIMDLDNFKEVNDLFGHACGDEVLKSVGDTLLHFFKFDSDIIGRLGGDEFVIFIRDIPSRDFIKKYCEDLCREINITRLYSGKKYQVSASMGIVFQDNGPDSFDHLYKCADEALYSRKRNNKNGVCVYQ